jgi:hypothetical protein
VGLDLNITTTTSANAYQTLAHSDNSARPYDDFLLTPMKKYDSILKMFQPQPGFSFVALIFGTPTTSKVAQALNYIKILSLSTEQREVSKFH